MRIMKNNKEQSIAALRAKAEALLQSTEQAEQDGKLTDIRKLVHELQDYQITLEAQNEDLRNAYAELERSKKRYLDFFHHAPVGYLALDHDGIIKEANRAFAGMIGKAAGDLIRQPLVELIVDDDQQIFRSQFQTFCKSPADKTIQIRLKSAVHDELHVVLRGSFADPFLAGSSAAADRELFVTVADITYRVMFDRSLQSSWEFAHAIIDSLPSHLCVLDEEGTIVTANEAWCAFARENGALPKSIAEGVNYLAVCDSAFGKDAETAQQFARAIRAIIDGSDQRFSFEYSCHSATEQRWFHGTVTALENLSSRSRHILVVHDRITDRKQLENERAILESRVQHLAKVESLKQMAEAVSQKFNSTLAAVLGNLEMALDHLPPDGSAGYHINAALQKAWQATEQCDLLRTYLGQGAEDKGVYDLVRLCRDGVAALQRTMPPDTPIDVSIPDVISLQANVDPRQIQQILTNLVTNAHEAISAEEQNNRITITLSSVTGDDIADQHRHPADWSAVHNRYACLAISDTASGIAPDQFNKIFDPFFSTKYPGRGMGLPVVLGILKGHNGVLTVESALNSGSIFRVYLPLVSAAMGKDSG